MNKENIEKEEFIRVGSTLYKLVNQPRLNGGHVKKRIVWNNETHHERRCRTLSDYFDEMMKEYVIILGYCLPAKKARTATADVVQNIIGMFGATAWEQGQPYLERCSLWMHSIGLTDTPSELLHSQTNPTGGGFVVSSKTQQDVFSVTPAFSGN